MLALAMPPQAGVQPPQTGGGSSVPAGSVRPPLVGGASVRNVRGTTSSSEELVVVMPTRVRVDSRVVFAHCTTSWLSNCVLCITLLAKLMGWTNSSWWVVFLPTWTYHLVNWPLLLTQLAFREHFLTKQIGPPPPSDASPGLHLQYNLLRSTRMRTFVLDVVNGILEGIGMCLTKGIFVKQLEDVWNNGASWGSFRTMFSPVWVAWVVITAISCFKNRHERIFGGARDLLFLFLLFVAFKLDKQSSYSWRLVFMIPWMWFSAMFLLTCMVFVLLVFARAWSRLGELVLPLGFFLLLVSCVPQFISYITLVDRLDGDGSASIQAILIPNAVSWFMMWLSSLLVCWGLRQKERLRAQLQAAGAVWTANEQIARQLHQTMEAAQRRIDDLNEDEISNLVQEMMQGKTKPQHLVKIGGALFRRMTAMTSLDSEFPTTAGNEDKLAAKLRTADACISLSNLGAKEGGVTSIGTGVEDQSIHRSISSPPGVCDASTSAFGVTCVEGEGGSEGADVSPLFHRQRTLHVSTGGDSALILDMNSECSPSSTAPLMCSARSETGSEDGACIICYDARAACVFLECGHGGFCRRCAHKLFVRPPHECPTCRQKIDQVVEVSEDGKIGDVLSVL